MRRLPCFAAFLGVLLVLASARADTVDLARGVRAAGLWAFPLAAQPQQYVYLPASAQLGETEDGRLEFSLLRYTSNQKTEPSKDSITRSGGGGFLTLLVQYDTPPQQVEACQSELRERLEDDKIRIVGPMPFSSGRFTLVSSLIEGDRVVRAREVIASGPAPILEGQKVALSIPLSPEGTSLLLASLRSSTPDLTLVFDLSFGGLTSAFDAQLEVDWTMVQESEAFKGGGTAIFVSADIERGFDALQRSGAIKLTTSGKNENMEALIDRVYDRLMTLMFDPVPPEGLTGVSLDKLKRELAKPFGERLGLLGGHVGYRTGKMRTTGRSVLRFNHRDRVERHSYVTYNAGEQIERLKEQGFVKTVNLSLDPFHQQRQIKVQLDGSLTRLAKDIDFITVSFRKVHRDGKIETSETTLSPATERAAAPFSYGWREGDTPRDWLNYEFRSHWGFRGGATHDSGWREVDAPVVTLVAPIKPLDLAVVGDGPALAAVGVRTVAVKLSYDFFGQPRKARPMLLRTKKASLDETLELIVPVSAETVDYEVSWKLKGGLTRTATGSESLGLLDINEIVEQMEN